MNLDIVDLERFTINLPFRGVPERNMFRALPDFTFIEILRVTSRAALSAQARLCIFTTDQEVGDSNYPGFTIKNKELRELFHDS